MKNDQSSNVGQEIDQWAEEIRKRSEFIGNTQDALLNSVEFQTLAHAYAVSPSSIRKQSLKQLADFAVLFVVKKESANA